MDRRQLIHWPSAALKAISRRPLPIFSRHRWRRPHARDIRIIGGQIGADRRRPKAAEPGRRRTRRGLISLSRPLLVRHPLRRRSSRRRLGDNFSSASRRRRTRNSVRRQRDVAYSSLLERSGLAVSPSLARWVAGRPDVFNIAVRRSVKLPTDRVHISVLVGVSRKQPKWSRRDSTWHKTAWKTPLRWEIHTNIMIWATTVLCWQCKIAY